MTGALLGVYSYAEFFGAAVAFLPAMGASHLRHRGDVTQRAPGRWMRRFGRVTSRLTPVWRFSVDGPTPPHILERAYVVVANHESTADPFLLSFLPWDMRWVAKEELFKLPLLGWLMQFGGDIPIRRGARESVEEMLDECRRTLAAGMPIMMFPEGTRSPDGRLLPFKPGAFQLAIEAGVPIVPVALAGTRHCRPKGSRWFGKARAHARVLEPISTAGMGPADIERLAEMTRRQIAEALPAVCEAVGVEPHRAALEVEAERASAPDDGEPTPRREHAA
ncbi:MAG: lysophospholipid acyltransferase family protein [Sorangiineae bacterium]|nr:lysophospholipid acyltransferase family protein [Polyangiaceae bacterium]MEB2324728.1 lysophospholipid acyltransferase family protein [Sorangiineae bacterium]